MMIKKFVSAATLTLLIGSGVAQASLISEASEFGADTITFDTQSGLEWLDLSVTVGRPFSDIASQLSTGGEFAGFHYATVADVTNLFYHAGIPQIGSPGQYGIDQFNAVNQLMGIVGGLLQTTDPAGLCPSCYGWYSLGITSDVGDTGSGRIYSYLGVTNEPPYGVIFGYANPAHGVQTENGNQVGMASWLVKAPVPEPETYWMLLCGLAVLSVTARKRAELR